MLFESKKRLFLLDGMALTYRALNCTSKAMEHYQTIQSLEVHERIKEQATKFIEDLQ